MYFTGCSICLLPSAGLVFQKLRLLEARRTNFRAQEVEEWCWGSGGGGQRTKLAGEWLRGPRSEAAAALRGPLSRVRGVGGC